METKTYWVMIIDLMAWGPLYDFLKNPQIDTGYYLICINQASPASGNSLVTAPPVFQWSNGNTASLHHV